MTQQNAIGSARRVGFVQVYTGTQDTSQGWFDDFDGKWVYLSLDLIRTIGNASSGAAIAAAWTETLFSHFWNQYDNTRCPILNSSGGASTRGANAAADYAANKRLTMPDYRGRVILTAGTGSTLTARTKGAQGGAETHTLSTPEIPPHSHTSVDNLLKYIGTGGNGDYVAPGVELIGTGINVAITNNTGGGEAHNNMPPWAAEHLIVSAGAR